MSGEQIQHFVAGGIMVALMAFVLAKAVEGVGDMFDPRDEDDDET